MSDTNESGLGIVIVLMKARMSVATVISSSEIWGFGRVVLLKRSYRATEDARRLFRIAQFPKIVHVLPTDATEASLKAIRCARGLN